MLVARLFLIPLIVCCMVTGAAAQKTTKNASTGEDYDKAFTKIEMEAGTNLGDWESYMRKSTVLPPSVRKAIPAGTDKVLIRFILDVHGKLSDIKAENDPGYGLAERALKVFKGYKGEWHPATQCGRLVKSYKKMPVIFVVSAE